MSFLIYFKDLFTALILRPLVRDPFRSVVTIVGVAIGCFGFSEYPVGQPADTVVFQ